MSGNGNSAHDHAGDAQRKVDWNAVTAIAAVVIAVIATLVSAYSAWEQHQQTRAQVWPHLIIGAAGVLPSDESASGVLTSHGGGLIAESQGVGPVIVDRVEFMVDHKAQRNWPSVYTALGYKPGSFGAFESQLDGNVLPPGKTEYFLMVEGRSQWEGFKQKLFRDTLIRVCYSSALHDYWIVALRDGQPIRSKPARSCRSIPVNDEFNG